MKKFLLPLLLISGLLVFGCLSSGGGAGASSTPAPSTGFQPVSGVVVNGSNVTIQYVGSFENGSVFDTNVPSEAAKAHITLPSVLPPLVVTVGAHQVIPGFEAALLGMKVGEEKTVHIPVDQAYGPFRPELVVTINASDLNTGGSPPAVGGIVTTSLGQRGRIIAVSNSTASNSSATNLTGANATINATVTIDFNHPLAGQALVFKIIVVAIQ